MAFIPNFAPDDHATVTLACTTSTGARQFASVVGQYQAVRLYNAGPDVVHVRFGNASPTATIASGATKGDVPIPVGDIEVFPVGQALFVAGICPTSTATLFITPGEGQ